MLPLSEKIGGQDVDDSFLDDSEACGRKLTISMAAIAVVVLLVCLGCVLVICIDPRRNRNDTVPPGKPTPPPVD